MHDTSLIGLLITLLGALVLSTWRFASITTKFQAGLTHLEDGEKRQNKQLAKVPKLESHIARLRDRLERLEPLAGIRPPSRPDLEEADEEDEDDGE